MLRLNPSSLKICFLFTKIVFLMSISRPLGINLNPPIFNSLLKRKFVKKSSKNTFFVKTTYSQCAGNQSVFFFGSGRIFLIFRDPLTASKGKIGGFRFKSPYREQKLVLLFNALHPLEIAIKKLGARGTTLIDAE